jgi:hypothetical protein
VKKSKKIHENKFKITIKNKRLTDERLYERKLLHGKKARAPTSYSHGGDAST